MILAWASPFNYTIACVWRQLCSFENRLVRVDHPGSDQLSQEGFQINIIADKTHAIRPTIIAIIHNVHVDLSL